MTLYDKIIKIYPDLTAQDFMTTVRLQNDSNGKGDYIHTWSHPTHQQPTQAQLDAITE
jgi:hypothetical protein